ncbi:MAG TPA: hypothetical protein PLD20_01810 [Blastocatellia bacterium]|nr:hypothetical protein [Blastocatellia bacterium]HMZ16672.1 hypothetical protein [Blastocatellia bacterium]HNG33877.1 hypothetical protein [Blastocatellia bacterium]
MQEPSENSGVKNPPDEDLATGLTDGRKRLDWHSYYGEPDAKKGIRFEAIYLAAILFFIPIVITFFWLEYPQRLLKLPEEKYRTLLKFCIAWLGGTLGGTLFAIKWLYRSVARQGWHLDRRLWRLFTPHLSGGLAFSVIALISSGIIRIFDRQAADSLSLIISIAFLVGYFSDSAIAKLTEVAETLFGASRPKEEHKEALKYEQCKYMPNENGPDLARRKVTGFQGQAIRPIDREKTGTD